MSIDRIGVCGAGSMGAGIAQVVAMGGAEIVVFDTSDGSLERAAAALSKALSSLAAKGRISDDDAAQVAARVSWWSSVESLDGAGLVIEAIVEKADAKAELFGRLEERLGEDAIIASNTSSLSITALARSLRRPSRFVGMHFFNPAPLMKLVEIVPGMATDERVTQRVQLLATRWGKAAVRVRDVPGFIVNRVARPYYAEGFRALAEGAAEASVIDATFRELAGFRMGPLELADLIGHDVNFEVARSVHDAYFGRTRFVPQLAQQRLVDAGRLGRKSGSGVYEYGESVPALAAAFVRPADSVAAAAARAALDQTLAAGQLERDGVHIRQTDGRTARSLARQASANVAVLDWRASEAAPLVFAASDDHAAATVGRLAGECGLAARRIDDRPGLLVMRSWAQIANAAADAALDQVAEEADIDTALRHGANYPLGPFEWSDRIGRHQLVDILDHLSHETGDGMYAASQYLRRTA